MCVGERSKKLGKHVVKEVTGDAYPFRVVRDLGGDIQGGHWFKDVAFCTCRSVAEKIAQNLNDYGVIYLPGNLGWTATETQDGKA
jgi:hypothetical protein